MVLMAGRLTAFSLVMILLVSSFIIITPNASSLSYQFFDNMEGAYLYHNHGGGATDGELSTSFSLSTTHSLKMDNADYAIKDIAGISAVETYIQFWFYPTTWASGGGENWDFTVLKDAVAQVGVIGSFGYEVKVESPASTWTTVGAFVGNQWNNIRIHLYNNYNTYSVQLNNGNAVVKNTLNAQTPNSIQLDANQISYNSVCYFDDIEVSNDGFIFYPFHIITANFLYDECGWMDINTIGGEWNWILNNNTHMMTGMPVEMEIFDTDNSSIGLVSTNTGTDGTWVYIYIMDAIRTHHGGIPNYGQYNVSVVGDLTAIGFGYSNTLWLHFNITNIISTSLTASLQPATVYYTSETILSGSWTYSSNFSNVLNQPIEISIYNQSGILMQTFSATSLPYGGWLSFDVMPVIRAYWNDSTAALGSYQISCTGLLAYSNSSNTVNVTLTIIAYQTNTGISGFSAIIWLLVSLFPALILATKFEKYGYTIGLLLMVIILGFAQAGYMFVTIIALIGIGITWWKG